jgi:WD40 repeat protein
MSAINNKKTRSVLCFLFFIAASSFSQENIYRTYPLNKGHDNVYFSPEKGRFISYGFSDTICEWDINTGKLVKSFLTNLNWTTKLDISQDGNYIGAISANLVFSSITNNYTIIIWDRLNPEKSYQIPKKSETLLCIEFSPDRKKFAVGYFYGKIDIYDTSSGDLLLSCIPQKIESIFNPKTEVIPLDQDLPLHAGSVRFSECGKNLYTGHADMHSRVWYVDNGALLGYYKSTEDSIIYSNDNTTYLTREINRTLLTDTKTNQVLAIFPYKYNRYSPDLKYLFERENSNLLLNLIDSETNDIIKSFEKDMVITNAEFSRDGKSILIGTKEDQAFLWDISDLYPSSVFNSEMSK